MIEKTRSTLQKLLPRNSFVRGVGVLVGGTVGAQLITLLAAPLLTRLYGPDEFGMLAVYVSLLALIGVVSSLRYELAIPLPESDVEAANVAILSLILVVLVTIISGIVLLQIGQDLASALGVPTLARYFWLLPIGVLLKGAYDVFSYWSLRTKRYTTIAATRLYQSLATITIQLVGFKLGFVALLLGQVAAQGVGTASLVRPVFAMHEFRQVSCRGIVRVAGRYWRFPAFTTWAGLLNSGGTQLPPILFASLFSAGFAGLYMLAHRVLSVPLSSIGEAVRSVFFSNAAAAYRENRLANQVEKLLEVLAIIAMPPLMVVAFAGPDIFSTVFGGDWRIAGEFARYMTPWLLMQFCVGPLVTTFAAIEKQHIGLVLQVQMFAIRITAILIGAAAADMNLALVLFSLGSSFSYLVFLFVLLRQVGAHFLIVIKSFLKTFTLSLMATSPLYGLYFVSLGGNVETFLLVFFGALFVSLYYIYFLTEVRKAKLDITQ